MKAVMISIQPKWCEKIASGEKTIEVRKTKPKCETPFKCYIYETKCKKGWAPRWLVNFADIITDRGFDKVIGEFVCDKIYNMCTYQTDFGHAENGFTKIAEFMGYLGDDDFRLLNSTCLTQAEIFDYVGTRLGFPKGWHISELKIYDKPKELSEFGVCLKNPLHEDCNDCCFSGTDCIGCGVYKPLIRPPQNWCYVEEKE